ncbi:MAG: hypothetical protein IPL73_00580 [Candidatus Obscuribacter sp.]|nr:hypothetical protein [Candidatus Obscuribacter sp.]
MKSVYNVLFWVIRVLVLTFAVGLILPHFDNIVLAAGLQNALIVATLFTLIGMGLRHAMRFATSILGGVVGFVVAVAGLFVLPAFALLGVSAVLPQVLTVHTFGAAFGAGLVTLVVDLVLGLCFGIVIAGLLLKAPPPAKQPKLPARSKKQNNNNNNNPNSLKVRTKTRIKAAKIKARVKTRKTSRNKPFLMA